MTNDASSGKLFRQALGAFVTGVTIVTTCDSEGNPVGLTANSFNSVSLDPPMVLWSLARNSRAMPVFQNAKHWAVHVLSSTQQDISNRFAKGGTDKFSGLDFDRGPSGVPLLAGYAARFVCKANFEYDGGDHAIFVGEVIEHDQSDIEPLVFHSGRYGQIMPSLPPPVPQDLEDDGEFARHFIGHILGLANSVAMEEVRMEYRARGLKGAEYTVLAAVGVGDGCSRADVRQRAHDGGVALPEKAIDSLCEKGLLETRNELLNLTIDGRRTLVELVAVAQASQLKLESRLSDREVGVLYNLLHKLVTA